MHVRKELPLCMGDVGGGVRWGSEIMCVVSLTPQWEVAKVKFLKNSNMTLTVLNLHQNTDPKVQQDFKGQGQIKVTP